MASPEFSVVIPTRGDSPHLRSALASALEDEDDAEVLLVHDRRKGDAPLPDGLTGQSRVRCLETDEPGPAAARNAGMDAARGAMLAFLDDDDLWLPGHLERARSLLAEHAGAVLVASDAHIFHDPTSDGSGSPPQDPGQLPRFHPGDTVRPLTQREMLLANRILTPTVVILRDRLTRDDRFRSRFRVMEDYELWLRLAARGDLLFDPRPGALVRRRLGSASRDLRPMAQHSLEILEPRLLGDRGRCPLSRREVRQRLGELWHDLAYACLIEGDSRGARRALRRSIGYLPLRVKNYAYGLISLFPAPGRRALIPGAR